MAEYTQEQYDKSIKKLMESQGSKDFSFSNAIELKNLANQYKGGYASFTDLASEYIRQHEDDKELLDSFKKMNPLVQRATILNELTSIINNAGRDFLENYKMAEILDKAEADEIRSRTIRNLRGEIDYLKDNATKQDLEFQRYKDIYEVPNWTNKAMNDFLQKGILPIGSEGDFDENGEFIPFYKGAGDFGAFMTGHKFDPKATKPEEEIFYDKVRQMYKTTPVEDRFSKATLAERFANKENLSNRDPMEAGLAGATRLIGFPYLNTLEQAKQAGAIPYDANSLPANEKWGGLNVGNEPIKNVGEMAFDTFMLDSPFKMIKPMKAGYQAIKGLNRFNNLQKVSKALRNPQIGLMAQSALLGGISGAKASLEGEEKAVDTTPSDLWKGFATGAGVGGAAYKLGRVAPKYGRGSRIDKELSNVNKELRNIGNSEKIQEELTDTEKALGAIKMRDEMFSGANIDKAGSYARKFMEPSNAGALSSADVFNMARNQQMTYMENNPLFLGKVENSPYEVGFSFNTPVQNTPRASGFSYDTPQRKFFSNTGYGAGVGVPLGTESEARQVLGNLTDFYAQNKDYSNALKVLGIDVSDKANRVNAGAAISREINSYADEPIARAILNNADDKAKNELYYPEWLKRNGLEDNLDSRTLFDDKFKMAQVNFLEGTSPTKFGTGRIEDTKVYKNINEKASNLPKEKKEKVQSLLDKSKQEGLNIDDVSRLLNEASDIAGGISSAQRYAADIRREMSPHVLLQSTFDRANVVMKAEEQARTLPATLEKAKEFETKKKFLEGVKQGYSPLAILLTNRISSVGGYGMAKNRTRTLGEDYAVSPVTEESANIENLQSGLPFNVFNYYWDSPLVRLRQAGSFNIPQEKK